MYGCVVCIYVYVPQEAKKGIRPSGTGITRAYFTSHYMGAGNSTQVLLQEQQLLLFHEPSLQPPQLSFITISFLKNLDFLSLFNFLIVLLKINSVLKTG